jgi:hypothetical protein
MRVSRVVSALLVLLALALPASAQSGYLRVVPGPKGRPKALQTAIAHFVMKGGQKVDLVAAVHLGDASYYQALNQRFKTYDAVLYELILSGAHKGEDTGPIVIPHDSDSASGLSQIQLTLCRMLGLKFQLWSVDYSAPNFHHADLSAAEFQAMMAKNGESTAGLLMKVLQVAMQNTDSLDADELDKIDIMALLYREPTPQEQRILRRVFAASFPQIEQLTSEIQGTTLIAGRDQRAVEVLQKQLRAGRRHLAIFYGAGHMPDLEKRLLGMGARLSGREWLDAWTL